MVVNTYCRTINNWPLGARCDDDEILSAEFHCWRFIESISRQFDWISRHSSIQIDTRLAWNHCAFDTFEWLCNTKVSSSVEKWHYSQFPSIRVRRCISPAILKFKNSVWKKERTEPIAYQFFFSPPGRMQCKRSALRQRFAGMVYSRRSDTHVFACIAYYVPSFPTWAPVRSAQSHSVALHRKFNVPKNCYFFHPRDQKF